MSRPASGPPAAWQDLRSLLLGFDVDPHDEGRVLAGYLAARAELADAGHRVAGEEIELLTVFADLSELSRNRPAGEESAEAAGCTAPASTSTPTCRASTSSGPGCRRRSRSRLARALGHYGVDGSLERTPELEEAVFRIFLAQQRGAADAAVVAALLREWLREAPPGESLREPAGLALEQLVAATQVRFPAVADLARGVVFAWFAQPLLRRNRARGLRGRAQAPAPPRPASGRPGPRRADRRDGRQLAAAGAAARACAWAATTSTTRRCSKC